MPAVDLAAAWRSALVAADHADAVARRHFRGPLQVHAKPDGTHVTHADTEIETVVRAHLAAAHPDHAVMGEEHGGNADPARPTWVIDPIDATANFLRGVPVFATLIALVVEGEAVVGVSSAPALGERLEGARGHGVRRNGRAVRVSTIADLRQAHVSLGGLARLRAVDRLWEGVDALLAQAWRVSAFGDFWSHALVACGAAEAAVEREVHLWDVAALACLVTEAGGRITDLDGAPVLSSPAASGGGDGPNAVVTSNGSLHDELLALLAGRG